MTFDPSLASGPSRASKLSLPTVSAAASAPPSLLARIGSPSVSTPQDGDTSRDASIQTTFCLGLDHHPFKKLSLVLVIFSLGLDHHPSLWLSTENRRVVLSP